ncbi:MAG: hypothetical protein IKB58_02650 [Oscillospiraceae bacterium]|nr:hypothetical protein [Oscillospiraceae bacterium]
MFAANAETLMAKHKQIAMKSAGIAFFIKTPFCEDIALLPDDVPLLELIWWQ